MVETYLGGNTDQTQIEESCEGKSDEVVEYFESKIEADGLSSRVLDGLPDLEYRIGTNIDVIGKEAENIYVGTAMHEHVKSEAEKLDVKTSSVVTGIEQSDGRGKSEL